MAQSSGGPPALPVGTEVSAKYRGAFCEAKVKTVQRVVKCKIAMKDCQISVIVTDEEIKGVVKLGSVVEVKHPDTGQPVEAVINKLIDNSIYTVVFDDGDERTLRRTQLCLKGDKHFIESETLDNLPLSHPEHFGTPVLQNKKSKRKHDTEDSDSGETGEDDESPRRTMYRGRHQELVGKLMLVDLPHRKGPAIPALVVLPDANSLNEVKNRDQILVRSFKDSKFLVVTRKDLKDFARVAAIKNDEKTMRMAFEKALLYHDTRELPVGWNREEMLGSDVDDEESGEEEDEYASEDEPFEEKDRFVAQLYKFMDERGTPINKAPTIANKDLNLYKLFKIVQNCGGYNKVSKEMKWPVVYSKMGLPSLHQNPTHHIKTAYKKYLDAYETFYRKLGSTMGTLSRPGRARNSNRSILNFRGRDKSPRSPKPAEKPKGAPESSKIKEDLVSTVDDDQDSVSIASEESDQAARRVTPRREPRSQLASKDDAKEKKEDVVVKKKEEKKDESPKVKKEEVSVKPRKDASPVPKGKKDDVKVKKEEPIKKDERKSSRKMKSEEEKEPDKDTKKLVRPVRKEKEEEKKDVKAETPASADSPKKRITRRKLITTLGAKSTDSKEPAEKKEVVEKSEVSLEKKDAPEKKEPPIVEKKEVGEKKEAGKKIMTRETKPLERKEIPRTLERRDSRTSERKEFASKIAEKKEIKSVEKKPKQVVDDKKAQKKEKKKDADEEGPVESEKSDNDGESDQDKPDSVIKKDFAIGSKLKVKYGRGKNQKIYIAKVVDTGKDGSHKTYLVHYAGWNTRYDEWIRPDRVVAVLEKSDGEKPKPAVQPKSLGMVTSTLKSSLKQLGAQKAPSIVKNRPSIFRTPKKTPKLGSAKTRATRSSSSELLTPAKKPGLRTTRRGSTKTESADSTKSSDGHVNSDVEGSVSSETMEEKSISNKEAGEEEDEILDVEQGEESSDSKASDAPKSVDTEPPKLSTEEPVSEQAEQQSLSTEQSTKGDDLSSDVLEESEVDTSKLEDGSVKSEISRAGNDQDQTATLECEEKLSVSEVKSVVMAEVSEALSEIKSVVNEEEKKEEKPVLVKDEKLETEDVPRPTEEIDEEIKKLSNVDEDEDEEDSPKLEIVEDSESPKELEKEMSVESIPSLNVGQDEEGASADHSIPQLRRIISLENEKEEKDLEKGRGVKGKKRELSRERKKSVKAQEACGEIPTLEPIVSPEVTDNSVTTVPKPEPSPYDFDADADSAWQPEMMKKWEPVQKVLSSLKDTLTTESDGGEEKEKKRVKKKTKKKILSPAFVSEDKVKEESKSPNSGKMCANDSETIPSPALQSESPVEKSAGPKKKGRKKKDVESDGKKEGQGQSESSGVSTGEIVQSAENSMSDKPPLKKRRTKRVSESDKKDILSRPLGGRKATTPKDNEDVLDSSITEENRGEDSQPTQTFDQEEASDTVTPCAASGSGLEQSAPGRRKEDSFCESQGFEPQLEDQDPNNVPFDNTPPTTPEQDEEEGGSPPQHSGAYSPAHDSSNKAAEPSKSTCSAAAISSSSSSLLPSSAVASSKSNSESPSDNDVTSTASTDNLYSTLTTHQSESSGTDQDVPAAKKRKLPDDAGAQVPKKKKKIHGTRSRTAKKSPKYSINDSMSYKNSDSQGSSSATPNHCPDSPANKFIDMSKSPRPSKYNFNADLGEYLEGEERCNFLISKMKEIKSIYMNLKSEVASIDRRRKRARRKERESVSQPVRNERETLAS